MEWSSLSLGNAAGFVKGPGSEFDDLLRSAATDITIGSLTLAPRDGNSGEVFWLEPDGTSINALGLPNPGLDEILLVAQNLSERAAAAQKRLRFSVAGFSPEDYGALARELAPFGEIELNLGCPNVWGDSGQKPIASFDLEVFEVILDQVAQSVPGQFDVKVSPYSDPGMILRVAELVRRFRERVGHVVTCNTFPNGVAFREERRALDTQYGYGGVAGNALYLIALGQVSQFAVALEGSGIGVTGVGGIDTGTRLAHMRCAGATRAQVGTAFGRRKGRVFSDLLEEATAIE